jgi:phage-related protein
MENGEIRAALSAERLYRVCGLVQRVIYLTRLQDAVYVLHAFQKKTSATSKQDVEIAKGRYAAPMRGRR